MEDVGRSWGWALGFGFLTLVLGILVMVWPQETLKIITILFGIQLLVTGVYSIFKGFGHGQEHRAMAFVLGLLALVVGIVVLKNVIATIGVLTIILGIYWIVFGVVEFIVAVSDSTYPSRGWAIFLSLLSVVAGIVILVWPIESVTLLAWVVGIWLAILGVLEIVMAFMIKSEMKKELKAA